MKRVELKIGGRKIPLRFRMNQFIEIEETVGNLGEIRELLYEGKKRLRNLISVVRILGNAGLKADGQEPDLTDEWLTECMDPFKTMQYTEAVISCISRESESEAAAEKNENEERDLVLEEISRKKDPVNSHTGG